MPLAFDSLSHQTVAFGFFHIETDMLLLQRLFFFADSFCRIVSELATGPKETPFEKILPGFSFPDPSEIGDLMGAIHGVRYSGFIGDLYQRHPFPKTPEDFRQKTQGRFTRQEIAAAIRHRAVVCNLCFKARVPNGPVSIGEYRFEKQVFRELIDYVWRGGYPRWEAKRRPAYVIQMKKAVENSDLPLLREMRFSNDGTAGS